MTKVLTDEELDMLAHVYEKIKTNKLFKKRWKTFGQLIEEYINKEAAYSLKGLGVNHGKTKISNR